MTSILAETSRRARQLAGSSLAELYLVAWERGALDLAIGVPSCPKTSPDLIASAAAVIGAGENQYEVPQGDRTLREQIAGMGATAADPDTELTITAGGTEAMCVALLATVDPGDEVIVLEPFYENFTGLLTLVGAVPRFVPLTRPGWRLDRQALADAFGPRTRAIMLNSPSNPTGQMLTGEELAEIGALCQKWNVTVISDEVYSHLAFDGRVHVSVADVPSLRPLSIVVGSLSKYLAVSGWRLGFLRADAARTQVLRRVHELTTFGTAAPLQKAVARSGVLVDPGWNPAWELVQRRDRVQDILTRFGLRFQPGQGGCFLLADISGVTSDDCGTWVRAVLERHGVLFLPGTPFFADPAHGRSYVRIAYNRTNEFIESAERSLLT